MNEHIFYTLLWSASILFSVAFLFVQSRDRILSNLFRKHAGFSPVHRWILYVLSLFALILILHTTKRESRSNSTSALQNQETLQEWIAVLDVQSPELFQRAQYLVQEEANAYRGVPVALFQAGLGSFDILVPPTYDLLYFNLILGTLSPPKNRQAANAIERESLRQAQQLSDTPLVAVTIFTDRAQEYSYHAGDNELQVLDVHAQAFQKDASIVERVRTERMKIGHAETQDPSIAYALEYFSLLVTAFATIVFCQAFRPKSLFLLLFLPALHAQDPSPLIKSAEVFYRQGDYEEASKILKGFGNEDSPYVLWDIALCQAALQNYDEASSRLDQIERRTQVLKLEVLTLREYMLFEKLQNSLRFPEVQTLQNVIQQASSLSSRTPEFNKWLMLSACTLRELKRLAGFTFPAAADVLNTRVKQSYFAQMVQTTDAETLRSSLNREIDAYSQIYKKTVPQHLFLFLEPVQIYCLGLIENYETETLNDVLAQLDRLYLLALFLASDEWEKGVENIFSACVEATLWKNQASFILKNRRNFLKGLLESFKLSENTLVSQEESYAAAFDDLELFRILYPENNRFYNAILAIENGDSIEVYARAFPILGLKDIAVEDRRRAKNQILRIWVDSGSYPIQAVRLTCERFLASALPMPIDQFQNSQLLDCLHLLINLPKSDGRKKTARTYLERIAPFFALAVARPFDIDIAETLNSWFQGFVDCMSAISFNEADSSLVKDAESSIQDAIQVLQAISGNSDSLGSTWNDQIRTILEKVQILYELVQEPQASAPLPNKNMASFQTASMLFDPLQLYRTLELRDRQLREENKPPKGGPG